MSIIRVSDNNTTCSLCKSTLTVFDEERGEIVCSYCGMIIQDRIESSKPGWGAHVTQEMKTKQRAETPMSLAIHDKGLSTFISYSNVDAMGAAFSSEQINKVKRLRRWDNISSYDDSIYGKNLKTVFWMMQSIKDKLSLTNSVIEKAAYFYRKALRKHLLKGRSIECMVIACIYAACRELNIPRTLDEISTATDSDSLLAGKCYRVLVMNLENNYLTRVDSRIYLSKIANKAKVSEKTFRRAVEMLAQVKEHPISEGKNPNVLAVAILYAACIIESEDITQGKIAQAGDTSTVALRRRFADIKQVLFVPD